MIRAVTKQEVPPFGRAIRAARGSRSVRSLAKAAGLSEGRWRQLENGYVSSGGAKVDARPSAESALAMADAVGLPRADAFSLAGIDASEHADLLASPSPFRIERASMWSPARPAESSDVPADAPREQIEAAALLRAGVRQGWSARGRLDELLKQAVALLDEREVDLPVDFVSAMRRILGRMAELQAEEFDAADVVETAFDVLLRPHHASTPTRPITDADLDVVVGSMGSGKTANFVASLREKAAAAGPAKEERRERGLSPVEIVAGQAPPHRADG
jgi:transcriptional regulator with XRE-family HTH domain